MMLPVGLAEALAMVLGLEMQARLQGRLPCVVSIGITLGGIYLLSKRMRHGGGS